MLFCSVLCVCVLILMLTFSRRTPVLLTSACRRAMVWFSLSKYELSGEPARLPLRLSEDMSPERKPLILFWPSLHCGFASGDKPNANRTSEISWMNSSLLGNWGRSSGSSMKWLSISTKHRLAWRVQESFHYNHWSMALVMWNISEKRISKRLRTIDGFPLQTLSKLLWYFLNVN